MPPLSAKHEAAVQAYLVPGTTQRDAYVSAGFKDNHNTESAAARFFRTEPVRARLAELRGEVAKKAVVSAERIVREIDRIALSDIGELYDEDGSLIHPKKLPPHIRRAISTVKVRRVSPENKFPAIKAEMLDRWEQIVMGRGLSFDISRALPSDVQAEMLGVIAALRKVDWTQEETIEVKLWDKNKGAEMAAKHRGVFSDDKTGAPQGVNIHQYVEVTRIMDRGEWLKNYGPAQEVGRPETARALARLADTRDRKGEARSREIAPDAVVRRG